MTGRPFRRYLLLQRLDPMEAFGINDTDRLQLMKKRALDAAATAFNWQAVSAPYRKVLTRLVCGGSSRR